MGWVDLPYASAQDRVTNFFLESPDHKISSRYVSILPYPEAAPVLPRSRLRIVTLQTRQIFRQSLGSQVTTQIGGPEINVTFRYNSKKV